MVCCCFDNSSLRCFPCRGEPLGGEFEVSLHEIIDFISCCLNKIKFWGISDSIYNRHISIEISQQVVGIGAIESSLRNHCIFLGLVFPNIFQFLLICENDDCICLWKHLAVCPIPVSFHLRIHCCELGNPVSVSKVLRPGVLSHVRPWKVGYKEGVVVLRILLSGGPGQASQVSLKSFNRYKCIVGT